MANRLHTTLFQQQRLTPATYHVLSILQLNQVDLSLYLHQLSETNPLLDVEWNNDFIPPDKSPQSGPIRSWEDFAASEDKLAEDLLVQLHCQRLAPEVNRVAEYLVGCLDDRGYLMESVEEICQHVGVSDDVAKEGIQALQRCEPAGIGARNVIECLVLQLDANSPLDQKVREHLEKASFTLSKQLIRQWPPFVRDRIGELQLRPAALWHAPKVAAIVPDLIVAGSADSFQVQLLSWGGPLVQLNEYYLTLLKQPRDFPTSNFLQMCYREASWIMHAITQRQGTLEKITTLLVEHQADWVFHKAPRRPLTMNYIAEALHIHESTVSRAIAGKYLQTPRGTLALKQFFVGGLTGGRTPVTSDTARSLILQLLQTHKGAPLTDQQIQSYLTHHGINISRRTVSKYRQQLGLGSSTARISAADRDQAWD